MCINKDNLEQTANLLQMFKEASSHIRKHIKKLEQESCQKLGSTHFLLYSSEWIQLASKLSKLSNSRQLKCLKDHNHRSLIIEFVRHRAVNLYNLSYFNGAKISDHYISFLCSQDPYIFTEILVIVNKMKLIHKHYSSKFQNKRFGENHIDIKIMKILEMCDNDQRKFNLNLEKFKAITEFKEDRYELTLQLGKMLRRAWILEKKKADKKQIQVQMSYVSSQHSFFHFRDEIDEIGRGQDAASQQLNFQMYAKIPFKDFIRTFSHR